MTDDDKKALRDLAHRARAKASPGGEQLMANERGLRLVEELASYLTGPDGMPGIKLYRDSPQRIRLQRSGRNAELAIEWQKDIGAVVFLPTYLGDARPPQRYVYDETHERWRRMEGARGIHDELAELLLTLLYPEAK